jgi:hypothetical protein
VKRLQLGIGIGIAAAALAVHAGSARADSDAADAAGGGGSAAETVEAGSRLPPLRFEDQHGEPHRLDASVALIVFTRDMDAGDIVKQTLAEDGAEVLAANRAVYISDIHGMPGLIRRLFALPSMRKRSYPMWLDVEGEDTKILPAREGQPALIHLDALTVTRIESVASVAALRAALGMPPAAAGDAE